MTFKQKTMVAGVCVLVAACGYLALRHFSSLARRGVTTMTPADAPAVDASGSSEDTREVSSTHPDVEVVRERLDHRSISLNAEDLSLDDVAQMISKLSGLPTDGAVCSPMAKDRTVTVAMTDQSLSSVLNEVCRCADLYWRIERDAIFIHAAEESSTSWAQIKADELRREHERSAAVLKAIRGAPGGAGDTYQSLWKEYKTLGADDREAARILLERVLSYRERRGLKPYAYIRAEQLLSELHGLLGAAEEERLSFVRFLDLLEAEYGESRAASEALAKASRRGGGGPYALLAASRYPNTEQGRHAALQLVQAREQKGEWEAALREYRRLIAEWSGDVVSTTKARHRMWRVLAQLGESREAIVVLDELVNDAQSERDLGFAYISRARCRMELGPQHYAAASRDLRTLIETLPGNSYGSAARQTLDYLEKRMAREAAGASSK